MSPDPIGINGGLRTNGYVENPSAWIDPWGLKKGIHGVAPDWETKGLHGTFGSGKGVELSIVPNNSGGFTYKPVFSGENPKAIQLAIQDAGEYFSSPKNVESALHKLEGAKHYYDKMGKGREWAEMRRSLKRLCCI